MPIYNPIDEYYKITERWRESYGLAYQVLNLQKEYSFIKGELDYLLATLSLDRNREQLRNGGGLEELFELVDTIIERIKNYNQKKEDNHEQ